MFHLFLVVNKLRLQVCIPIECDPFKRSNELLHQAISLSASIAARFNEVSDVLFGIALTIKFAEFRGLLAIGACEGHQSFLYRALCTNVSCEVLPSIEP